MAFMSYGKEIFIYQNYGTIVLLSFLRVGVYLMNLRQKSTLKWGEGDPDIRRH